MQNSVMLDNHISPGFFKSQEEMMFFLLLSEIQKQEEPLGSSFLLITSKSLPYGNDAIIFLGFLQYLCLDVEG